MELLKRIFAAALFLPLFFYCAFFEKTYPFFILTSIILVTCFLEYARLFKAKGISVEIPFSLLCLVAICLFWTVVPKDWNLFAFLGIALVVVLVAFFFNLVFTLLRRGGGHDIQDVSLTIFGILYLVLLAHLILVKRILGAGVLFFLVSVVWVTDTLSFAIGAGLGRHKVFLSISPKKTLEGSIGGLIFSMITACGLRHFAELTLVQSLFMGASLGILAQLGDLFESKIKRFAEVKDSSGLIPGHGGVLDVFDSLFLTAPFTIYLTYIMPKID